MGQSGRTLDAGEEDSCQGAFYGDFRMPGLLLAVPISSCALGYVDSSASQWDILLVDLYGLSVANVILLAPELS